MILGVITLDGDDDAELLEDIFTGVVDPDTCVGDLDEDDALLEKAEVNSCVARHDAQCQPDISLSLMTGLWQSCKENNIVSTDFLVLNL